MLLFILLIFSRIGRMVNCNGLLLFLVFFLLLLYFLFSGRGWLVKLNCLLPQWLKTIGRNPIRIWLCSLFSYFRLELFLHCPFFLVFQGGIEWWLFTWTLPQKTNNYMYLKAKTIYQITFKKSFILTTVRTKQYIYS